MTRMNVYIPNPDMAALSRLSVARDLSVAELIRQAIAAYLRSADATPAPTRSTAADTAAER